MIIAKKFICPIAKIEFYHLYLTSKKVTEKKHTCREIYNYLSPISLCNLHKVY